MPVSTSKKTSKKKAPVKTGQNARIKKNALGRGLSALIPEDNMALLNQSAQGSNEPDAGAAGIQEVPLSQIIANPEQPRRNFPQQELDELAASIKEHGILQPVLLRPFADAGGGIYEIVAGERRWRASQAAGLTAIPAIIQELGDKEALEVAIIENVQRQDISALDAATAYRRLQREFNLSQEEIATRVSKSRAAIANTLRLLELPEEVQSAITGSQISEGHGRAILGARSDEARRAILRRVLRDGLTVRQTEQLARTSDAPAGNSRQNARAVHQSADERHLQDKLQQALGTRVQLKTGRRGGQIIISYFSEDELEGLLEQLGV